MRKMVHRAVGPAMVVATVGLALWALLGGYPDPALLEGRDSSEADLASLQWVYHVIMVAFIWPLITGGLIVVGALTAPRGPDEGER